MQLFSIPGFIQKNHYFQSKKQKLIQQALYCLEQDMQYTSMTLNNPENVKDYMRLQLGNEINEVFAVLFLDNQYRLITCEKLFFGSIHKTVIHPRVILQRALHFNAAAVILAHNHPSGDLTPSPEDIAVTQELKKILAIVDVNVLDHIIVSPDGASAFSDGGWLA